MKPRYSTDVEPAARRTRSTGVEKEIGPGWADVLPSGWVRQVPAARPCNTSPDAVRITRHAVTVDPLMATGNVSPPAAALARTPAVGTIRVSRRSRQ